MRATHYCRFHHRRMFQQYTFHFKGPYAVIRAFDDIIITPHKPDVAFLIFVSFVAGVVQVKLEHVFFLLRIAKVLEENTVGFTSIGFYTNVAFFIGG